jgi:hypothetical protein
MTLGETIKRELVITFSKHAQPLWFRVLKYTIIGSMVYLFWGSELLWEFLAIVFVVALIGHFWFRYKTHGWTKNYGPWKHELVDSNDTLLPNSEDPKE